MGGCAPYVSSFGIFKSSTKIIIRLPAGAPKMKQVQKSNVLIQLWKQVTWMQQVVD